MRARGVLVCGIAIVLVACGSGNEKPAPSQDGTAAAGTTTAVPSGATATCTIAPSPTQFSLPIIAGLQTASFREVTGRASCTNGREVFYELRDMNGDRQPDLVLRSACDDTTIGALAWRVYFNTGAGFDANPTRFELPLPRPPACALVELVDVDGDLRPDLVTTSTCLDASVGTTRWIVHRNNGGGFDAPVDFALPLAPVKGAFTHFESQGLVATCPGGGPAYRTFDVDGDLKSDLVVVSACDDALLSTTSWRVYPGTGAGFADASKAFALPTVPAPVRKMYGDPHRATADCDASPLARSYELGDFDGDFAPDLLVTRQCNDPTVGSTRWLFYRNDGTRLAAEPRAIELPPIVGAVGNHGAFVTTSAPAQCEARHPAFTLVDVTGDFKKDLLVTRACNDPTSGVSRWHLHPQGVDGAFAKTPVALTLPAALGGRSDAPLGLSAQAGCERETTKRPAYFASALTASRFGLVVTTTCLDPSVGHSKWLIHGNDCVANP